jgi:S1-C subfamily serine protease/AAA+ superfamily predicted ATPase
MQHFLTSNPGLTGRFSTKIHLRDFNPEELLQIFEQMVNERGHTIDDKMRETMSSFFKRMYDWRNNSNYFEVNAEGKSTYRNAGTVRNFVDAMLREQAYRLSGDVSTELSVEDIPERYRAFLGTPRQSVDANQELKQAMDELNSLIGLQPVKKLVERLVIEQRLAISLERDLNASDKTRHMLFTGNPGTGKTTVARLIGRIYKALGLLRKGDFTEVNYTELVGQYIGETAQKTKQVIDSALDGVLFIDEAYSLSQSEHSYGMEAINTLVPALESHRNSLVVIFAGYTLEMEQFVRANSGIASRMGRTIEFPDYSPDELVQIFHAMAHAKGYDVPEEVDDELRRQFEFLTSDADSTRKFGNARGVRVQFFDKMVDEFDGRMYEALQQGQDVRSYPRGFVLSDVPQVVAQQKQSAIPSSGRTYKFHITELAIGQDWLALPSSDIPERVAQSVGLIKTDRGTGTGFMISPNGHLLTAYHVIDGAGSIEFRINGANDFRKATYLDGDKDADLVILKLEGHDWPFTPLVAAGYELHRGTALGLLGYPMGESLGTEVTYTSGDLSSIRRSAAGVRVFQIDVSAYRGNSGGPVFLRQTGEAVGVLSFGPNDTMNFAVSVEELYDRFR